MSARPERVRLKIAPPKRTPSERMHLAISASRPLNKAARAWLAAPAEERQAAVDFINGGDADDGWAMVNRLSSTLTALLVAIDQLAPGAGPHDRSDCPCGHPFGERGPCAGCNCGDKP